LNVGSFTCINKKTLLIEDYFILQDVIAPILQVEIEENGDLCLDIAEAFMDNKSFEEAKAILEQLVSSTNYSLVSLIIPEIISLRRA
jgi:thioredoxin-like negative regulator of GroEL